jgi:transposase InsO family protein
MRDITRGQIKTGFVVTLAKGFSVRWGRMPKAVAVRLANASQYWSLRRVKRKAAGVAPAQAGHAHPARCQTEAAAARFHNVRQRRRFAGCADN